jgi:polysaccharide pyruvyl transferase WcaK-like protein
MADKKKESFLNMDTLNEGLSAGLIELSRFPGALAKLKIIPGHDQWAPGKKLKVLMAGYCGARNTGADVRVKELIDQWFHFLGPDNVEIGVTTLNTDLVKCYWGGAGEKTKVEKIDYIYHRDVLRLCSEYHMAVMVEGSCFKSKFANALTTMMTMAAGIMASQGKPCLAYGSEAGQMDRVLETFVRHYAKNAFIISRTENSHQVVKKLGLQGDVGTDTAWTFKPGPRPWAVQALKAAGWDGKKPVIGLAIIDPFVWPVRPDLLRFLSNKARGVKEGGDPMNVRQWYFFTDSSERRAAFRHYIEEIAGALDEFLKTHDAFPIILGMEMLDDRPTREFVAACRGVKPPIFCSKDYDGYQMTSLLHLLRFLVSSRYHACVLSMTGGVPSAGVTMDERIANLMEERGHFQRLCIKTDEPEMKQRVAGLMSDLWDNGDEIREEILRKLPGYLKKMAYMAEVTKKLIREWFPGIKIKADPKDWTGYIHPLYPELKKVLEDYKKYADK